MTRIPIIPMKTDASGIF